MLTLIEKVVFFWAVVVSLYTATATFDRMFKVIMRGQGELYFDNLPKRIYEGLSTMLTLKPVFKTRLVSSLFHAAVAWGFIYYFLINAFDVLGGYIPAVHTWLESDAMGIYRLLGDILSIGVLVGVAYFLLRRFVANSPLLRHRENVLLHPHAAQGMRTDSLIVGVFIFLHVGFRFLGESFSLAAHGSDAWQPFANVVSHLWGGMSESAQIVGWHASWWIALGLILAFIPYFPYTKHIHLMVGPFNFATRPQRRSIGEVPPLDFEDESIEQFGAAKLTDLDKTQIVDAFACIMCNRCQDVCPAYSTGKELSPSALEINKRYGIKEHFGVLALGEADPFNLVDVAISESALWACTTCGACTEVCPMGNEPFTDILAMRRNQVLMESEFPAELQQAFKGMERNGNPWQMSNDRLEWTQPLDFKVPTVEDNPDFDVLYWVGCAGAFDPNSQETARAFAGILDKAGVNYAVLGNQETCTGDTARRAGNEYLFTEMAMGNIETLNGAGVKKIVATCPHCLHTIKNEYPQFGGEYEVVHHTEFINDLIGSGKIQLTGNKLDSVTFHDPCYLGRHNDVYDAPREVLTQLSVSVPEMEHNGSNSFCCGAGGAQMWKEEEEGFATINLTRFHEAEATGAETVAVGCPFCNSMLTDANKEEGEKLAVKDIAQIVVENLA